MRRTSRPAKRRKARKPVCRPRAATPKRAASKRAAKKQRAAARCRAPVKRARRRAPGRRPAVKRPAPPSTTHPSLPPLPADTPVPGLPPVDQQPPPPPPPPDPPPPDPAPAGVHRYGGPFGVEQATRLLWRAGFGPRRGEAAQFAALGLDGAVAALTRVDGPAQLIGPAPYTEFDDHLEPGVLFEHDHLGWMDRMVRSTQPFVERIALLWHDWFGISDDNVGQYTLLARHIELFRAHGRGSFRQLARLVMEDGAMLVRLDGVSSQRHRPNENFARELMELFTLGPDRGAYTERDIREAARGLTGWSGEFHQPNGWSRFWFDPQWHDASDKRIFGVTDDFDPDDVVDACVTHRLHPSFFVLKLWSAFVAAPPPADQRIALERLYVERGFEVLPVIEAILKHPAVYEGPPLVKPPVVYAAGLLRAVGGGIQSIGWTGVTGNAGQRLHYPPNIAGWREDRWLDTSTLHARWELAGLALKPRALGPGSPYPAQETPAEAVAMAARFWDDPPLREDTVAALVETAGRLGQVADGDLPPAARNAMRQTILRHLLIASPDGQVC
jgi:hypothetical protein